MDSNQNSSRNIQLGIAWAMFSAFCFTVMDAAAKQLVKEYHPIQIVFLRAIFAFIPVLIWVYCKSSFAELRTYQPLLHIVRSLMGFIALFCAIVGLKYLPLAEYTVICFTSPLFLTALSIPMLKEKVGWHRWLAVIIGFMGTLIIIRPGFEVFNIGVLFALGTSISISLLIIFSRQISWTESSASMVFWYSVISIIFALFFIPFYWETPSLTHMFVFLVVGVVGGLAQLAMIESVRLAPPSVVAPFDYTSILWATMFGYYFFAEIPQEYTVIGAAFIILSGLYILHRESQINKKVKK